MTTLTDLPTDVVRLPAGPVEYRLDRRGDGVVVVLHGGHMRAGLTVDEGVFADAGLTVLAPSRPGYGRTPLGTGGSATGFADATAELCAHLGITRVAAVVGISAGGRTALALAARHPDLVERLILQCAVGNLPWPDRRTRIAAGLIFSPRTERLTWAGMRRLLHSSPGLGLRFLLGDLSTVPVRRVLAGLRPEHRDRLIAVLSRMRSGSGFQNDLRPVPDLTGDVTAPTLVIATRKDGSVPFAHAERLVASIHQAQLIESEADSHFVEFGADWPAIARTIRTFLTAQRPPP